MKKYILSSLLCLIFIGSLAQSKKNVKRNTINLYAGDKRDISEVALICKGTGFAFQKGFPATEEVVAGNTYIGSMTTAVFRTSIENPTKKDKMKNFNYAKCVEVLPTNVSISVYCDQYYGNWQVAPRQSYALLEFAVEAGHTYIVFGYSGPSPSTWVIDRNTSKIVVKKGAIPDKFFQANPSIHR